MNETKITDFDLLVLGELFTEFFCEGDIALSNAFSKDIGGSDIYVAASASKMGSSISILSAVARDPFHSFIRDRLISCGINTDHLVTCDGYNGIYFTNKRNSDEREYLYHRPGSAASSHISPSMVYDSLIQDSKAVYSSSELQSASKAARHAVFKAFHFAHTHNILVAYDPNLRLHRWSLDDAKESLWSVLPLIDIIFPSCPEESKALFGYERPLDVIGFLWDRGVSIVAVKTGANGCMIGYDGKIEEIEPEYNDGKLTYMTLIGSVFNGVFLNGITKGMDPFSAGRLANKAAVFKGLQGNGIKSLPAIEDLK